MEECQASGCGLIDMGEVDWNVTSASLAAVRECEWWKAVGRSSQAVGKSSSIQRFFTEYDRKWKYGSLEVRKRNYGVQVTSLLPLQTLRPKLGSRSSCRTSYLERTAGSPERPIGSNGTSVLAHYEIVWRPLTLLDDFVLLEQLDQYTGPRLLRL